ncbi:DUF5895 domain-containing protein [Chamaesiphon sp. VAR_48_metabat_403]|uniref:DUF5895 domain-containing protein n=1 Tax=Chamaesiphon sp. VAR_48_metabat_403 TaxID=2964700 RepID=UPI00286DBF7B|nr:DUF5895 domain-containing protein [Chamaesiphon sp. VAR_48_metabat_403]
MTYSKTRATKDTTAEYSSTTDLQPSSGTNGQRSTATIDEINITPSSRLDVTEEILVVPSAAEVKDRFAAPEYVNPNARLPRIQALRGENGPIDCGYFITETEMAKAGWQNVDESELIIYEYNSGGKERGLLIQSPRMLVVPRSPLFAFDRQVSRQEERLVVAGQYSKQLYSDRAQYGTAQCYEILLLDEQNQPLHEIGFAYVAKGANQASFSFHWQQLVNEVTKCHAIANSIPARAKDARFNSLCVFQFTVKRELAGNNAKSPACKVYSHVAPTQANWEQFFLGRQDAIADRFLNLLAPTTELTLPRSNTLNLLDKPEDEIVGELAA